MKGTSCWPIDEDNSRFPQFKDSDLLSDHWHSDEYEHQQVQPFRIAFGPYQNVSLFPSVEHFNGALSVEYLPTRVRPLAPETKMQLRVADLELT